MSKKKNKQPYCDIRACLGVKDRFGTLYDGMCTSKAYIELSIGAKQFYTLCRVQAQSARGKACLYKHAEEFGISYNDHCFVFPSSHLEKYGYDRSNAVKYFNELVAAGFIKKLERNKHLKKVNVYEFIEDWKNSS